MEDNSWDAVPTLSLPLAVTVPLSLLFLAILILAARRLRDPASIFVLSAAWLRYVVSTFHAYTYTKGIGGLSINAGVSILLFLIGVVIVAPGEFKRKTLVPIYLLLAVAAASAAVNGEWGGFTTVLTKWGYLSVVMLATVTAFRRHGDRFFTYLLIVFLPSFVFQWISVVLHIPRSLDADGGQSFIGGYNHEAGFSVVLCTALLVPCLARRMWWPLRSAALFAALVGLLLANYRTAIVAFLPFLLVFLAKSLVRFRHAERALFAMMGAAALVAGFAAFSDKVEDRFADLSQAGKFPGYVLTPPDDLSKDERDLMSARIYLWSRYIDAWENGPAHYELIGAGPEARIPTKDKYPHNTLVSALYEYGLFGVATFLLIFGTMLALSLRAARDERALLVAGQLSFFLLNMSTMPLWQIEGNILYGLLCGYTIYSVARGRVAERRYLPAPVAIAGRRAAPA